MQSHTYIGETLPSLLIPDLSIRRLIEYILLLPPRPLPGSDDLASFVDPYEILPRYDYTRSVHRVLPSRSYTMQAAVRVSGGEHAVKNTYGFRK